MSLIENSQIHSVLGISDEEHQIITDFLQGAVYCWCKNRKNEWLSLIVLFNKPAISGNVVVKKMVDAFSKRVCY